MRDIGEIWDRFIKFDIQVAHMLLTHGLEYTEYTSDSRVVEANKPPRINLLDLIARFFDMSKAIHVVIF